MEPLHIQNIIDGNGISISLGGMLIVFGGLLFISVYVALLPKVLDLFSKEKKSSAEEAESLETKCSKKREIDINKDIASVIGLVLQMEQERRVQFGNQALTFNRSHPQQLNLREAGKLRIMPNRRKNAQIRS